MVKILVIEDESVIREEVMTWLDIEGYEVFGAENGKLGLDLIQREYPDIVLCDVNMPEMDGHQVLFEVRSSLEHSQLSFIFLTAAADRDAIRDGMNLGADDYITKPFTYSEVSNAVKTRLQKRNQTKLQIQQLSNLIDEERNLRLLKSRLIGMFSHDFRNPLTTILSTSSMLQTFANQLTSEQLVQRLQRIDGATHLLLQMLDEMLIVAQIENGELSNNPEVTDLTKLIEKTIGDFQLIDGDKHQFSVSIDLPEQVMIDPKLVHHIISNFISNALKYSPAQTEVSLQAFVENEQIVVSVQDSGIGIPEEDIPKVFEPFFRARNAKIAKGTGLGLALVKAAVDVCEGRIEVSSEVGRGSLFSMIIPLRH